MDDRDKILAKLSAMLPEDLDKMRDKLHLEQLELIKEHAKAKEEELIMKHDKRNALLAQGQSFSKAELMLRADEELYLKKKILLALSTKKKELAIRLSLVESFFWKNK